MTAERNDGGPAFPEWIQVGGMSLRDYAAIQFIAAWTQVLANADDDEGIDWDDARTRAVYYGTAQADLFIRIREGK